MSAGGGTGYRDTWLWNLGFSAYWFATSYKWFNLLLVILPGQVFDILVNEGETVFRLTHEQAVARADLIKNSKWGLVVFLGGIWALFGPMIFGGWSDKVRTKWGHRQPFLAAGAALTVISLFILADAKAFWVLIVGYLLLQFSDDVGTGPYSAMVPEIVPEERRGRASSVMSMLQLVGQVGSSVAALVIYGAIKDPTAALKTVYLGVASTNVLCAVFTIYTIRKVRPHEQAREDTEPFFKKWIRPFKSADFRWVWFTRLLSALGFFLVSTYLRNYLNDAFDSYSIFGFELDSSSEATNIIGLTISVTGAIGAGVASKYADTWGRKRLIYVAGVVIFCIMIPFSIVRDFSVAWGLACVFGAAYGLYLSADWALVSDVIPNKHAAGIEMGVWASSIVSVQLLSGLYGSVIDWGNARSASGLAGYMSAILLAGCVFLLGTILVRQVKGSR